jgi:tetratricopeptide (TPR) repeat protein
VGEEKIEQRIEVSGNAQTGDITLIGKLVNVIQIIKQPALWQDAVWKFITQNWVFIISCIFVQGLVLLVYSHYKNLFLIPTLSCVVLEVLIIFVVWGINSGIRRKASRTTLLVALLSLLSSLGLIGWTSAPIIQPQKFQTEKFGIAIATFGEGADYQLSDTAREVSGQVYEGLCQTLRQKLESSEQNDPCETDSSDSNILVKQIGVISDSETAKWYAHRINADVVIWGQVLRSGKGTATIRFQIDETLDRSVNPEYPVVLPVTTNFTELISKEIDFDSDPVRLKAIVSQQTTYIASFALGLFAYLQRDYSSAVTFFEIAKEIADYPDNIDVNPKSNALLYLYLGRSYNGMSRFDKGQPALLSGMGFNSQEPAILISLALGYGSLGQNEERDKYIKDAFDAIGAWLTVHPSGTEAALYDRGVIYQIWKQYSDAVIDFEAVIKNNPNYYVAYLNLAQAYSESGDYQKAVQVLDKAIDLSKASKANPAWAHLNLAIIHEKFGNYDAAHDEYKNAVTYSPNSSEMYAAYGLFLEKDNEMNGARAALNKMVETSWDQGWAHGVLADFLMRNGLTNEAVNNFKMAIHYKPEDDLLHTKLAKAYSKLGNFQGAESEFTTAISLPSASYYSFAEYAGFLYQQSDYKQAVEMYYKALEEKPEDAAILLNLGQTYQTINETNKAIQIYRHITNTTDIFSEADIQIAHERLQALSTTP